MAQESKARKGERMAENRRETFARMLYVHRRRLGYTQEQLAALIGESPQMISAIEKGLKLPSFDKLFQIADFFKTTVDAMTGGLPAGVCSPTYIDAEFSASDGSMMFIGTHDLAAIGRAVDLFVKVRQPPAPAPPEPSDAALDA